MAKIIVVGWSEEGVWARSTIHLSQVLRHSTEMIGLLLPSDEFLLSWSVVGVVMEHASNSWVMMAIITVSIVMVAVVMVSIFMMDWSVVVLTVDLWVVVFVVIDRVVVVVSVDIGILVRVVWLMVV